MNKKKIQRRGFSALVLCLFLAGIILLNVFVGLLSSRFDLKVDITTQGLYSISDQTREVLSSMTKDITVTVLGNQSVWELDNRLMIVELLNTYATNSGGRITVNYINPELNPAITERYPLLSNLAPGDIIFESGTRYTSAKDTDLFTYSYNYTNYTQTVTGLKAEQTFTSAILYVLSDKTSKAVFLTNHGEIATSELKSLLETANFEIVNVNLISEDIPEDAAILFSVGPKTDFTYGELDKVEAFLTSGGNAAILYDYTTLGLTNLELYLVEWGIAVKNQIAMDSTYMFRAPYEIALRVGTTDETILPNVAALPTNSGYIAMYIGRVLEPLWSTGEKGNRRTINVLTTHSTAYAKDFTAENIDSLSTTQESGDATGTMPVGILGQFKDYDSNNKPYYGNLFVSTASLVYDSMYLSVGGTLNLQFITALANDFNPFGQSVIISDKSFSSEKLSVVGGQQRAILIILVVIIPLTIIGLGILMWRRRKSL